MTDSMCADVRGGPTSTETVLFRQKCLLIVASSGVNASPDLHAHNSWVGFRHSSLQ